MAKKKNAPILRGQSEGGDQPITTTVTKSYAVRDKWLDKAKDNLVEFKSVDGEISDLMINGEPPGGGGFTTVTVNVANDTQDGFEIYLSNIRSGAVYSNISCAPGMDEDFDVILGPSGVSIGHLPTTSGFTAEGNIEIVSDLVRVYGQGGIHR